MNGLPGDPTGAYGPKGMTEEEMKKQTEKIEAQRKLDQTAWDELTDSQKIERMHDVVKNIQWNVNHMVARVHKISNHFYGHTHSDETGKLMRELKEYGDEGAELSTSARTIENYF